MCRSYSDTSTRNSSPRRRRGTVISPDEIAFMEHAAA